MNKLKILRDRLESLEKWKFLQENDVNNCMKCGGIFKNEYLKSVLKIIPGASAYRNYCQRCVPPYDRSNFCEIGNPRYYRDNMPCDENGRILNVEK